MDNILTTFRCTQCWAPVREDRIVDTRGHCIHCGNDVHRVWPWNDRIIMCPVTGDNYLEKCGCRSETKANQPIK
jgi:DNA-directed RNA polymerase subunit RPC12/RpoP